ncbi:MAG: threonine--tRNA ligase [Rickettsiales bacterium]
MINIIFPDGSKKDFSKGITGFEVAQSISPSLAKKALAINVNSKLVDLSLPINEDAKIKIITPQDPEGLDIIRHDSAHILAQAIKNLFPETQITIGPVIENGFYYDILPKKPLSENDLRDLEKEMKRITQQNYEFQREIWTKDNAIKMFKDIGEDFKAEIITDIIPDGEDISLYRQGDFIDLCRGPHAPSTKHIKHYRLTKIAGAYWRGDSNNVMLQRIYGTAWSTEEELDGYLKMIEEAEKRDHRKIGRDLDLFHIQEEAPGMVFWHNKGWAVYRIVENYIRNKIAQHDYIEVKTPTLVDRSLWEKSGHWEKFRENMFVSEDEDKRVMALKPMNCPCHIEIFKKGLKSYRDLPLRMAEFGSCHRNEPSGSLHGLMRVRGFVQDDAHIFCTKDQITSETVAFCDLLKEVYKDFGFHHISIKFSDRPEKRSGSDEIWNEAESSLMNALKSTGLPYTINKGEGAFYGPKLEFVLKDAIGREWQCGTLQVDFVLPERLQASYIGKDGDKHVPVILHRAILGSLERFIGILIEEHEGKFPFWLAPEQVSVLNITDEVRDYAVEINELLQEKQFRSVLDISNEKINYKVRQHSHQKIPVLVIIGKKERESRTVSIRELGSNDTKTISLSELFTYLSNKQRSLR